MDEKIVAVELDTDPPFFLFFEQIRNALTRMPMKYRHRLYLWLSLEFGVPYAASSEEVVSDLGINESKDQGHGRADQDGSVGQEYRSSDRDREGRPSSSSHVKPPTKPSTTRTKPISKRRKGSSKFNNRRP